ncbi:MAG: hypothetical protein A3I05_03370 [Deltaproteobacteria bacterium RIFCSPLOWO2_02_FULL_44_10]|nr:MAG: hypothetical protein A3C46_02945 [Deltaproteobacteria bacterium RIFCSPHIGHO2_02_FULL_44_16]OGQ46213.1 MAG: hypothetical protein A3I05_03370 [Deltaproteobacteria bacterium RIFCSPLOWO2_02_FULL_44_10]
MSIIRNIGPKSDIPRNDHSPDRLHRDERPYGQPEEQGAPSDFGDRLEAQRLLQRGSSARTAKLSPEEEADLARDLTAIVDYVSETQVGYNSLSPSDKSFYADNSAGIPGVQAYSQVRTNLEDALRMAAFADLPKNTKNSDTA